MSAVATERDNHLWLSDLSAEGSSDLERRRERAQADLREFLRRGLTRSLAGRGVAAHSVEDFVQEAMLKILDRLSDFRGDSQFTTWAMAIAVRTAFAEMRRARWRDHSLDEMIGGGETEAMSGLFAVPSDAEDNVQRRQVTAVMQDVIHQLAPRQRKVLLWELAGVPKSVMAERLETTTNALYKSTHDARRKLREGMLATGLSEQEIRAALTHA